MTFLKKLRNIKRTALARVAYGSRYVLPEGKRRPKTPPENILVVTTTGYGDTLWSIPAIGKLRHQFPEAHLAVLVGKVSYPILQHCPWIDEFFHYSSRFDAFFSWPRLVRKLYRRRFDRTYFLHYSDSTIVPLCLLAQTRGFHGAGASLRGLDRYFDFIAPEIQHDFIERRLTTIGSFDHTESEKDITIFLGTEDLAARDAFLALHALNKDEPRLWIGFQVGSRLKKKEWPAERFVELGQRCAQQYDARIFVFGSPDEKMLVNSIAAKVPNSICVIGPSVTLRSAMALISDMDGFVTNDTGPMHVALAERIPTVALFGYTPIYSCGHYTTQKHVRAIKSPSDGDDAMEEISVETAWNALNELLRAHDDARDNPRKATQS